MTIALAIDLDVELVDGGCEGFAAELVDFLDVWLVAQVVDVGEDLGGGDEGDDGVAGAFFFLLAFEVQEVGVGAELECSACDDFADAASGESGDGDRLGSTGVGVCLGEEGL